MSLQAEQQEPRSAETPVLPVSSGEEPVEAAMPQRWRWISLGLVILALFAYPVVRWAGGGGDSSASAASMLHSSFQLYQAKRYVEAITMAKSVLNVDPNSADAYNNLAVSYAAMNQWEAAINNVQTALRIDPNNRLAKNNLEWFLQQRQGTAAAAAALPEGGAEFFLNKSLREAQAGDNAASLASAQQAAKLRPDYAEAYNNIAVAQIGLKRYDEAIAAAETALRLKPDFQLAANNLRWALLEKQKAAAK